MSDNYKIIDFQEYLDADQDMGQELYNRNGVSFQLFHLETHTSLQITHSDLSFDNKIYMIIVLAGSIDLMLPDKRVTLTKGQMFSHESTNCLYIRANESANLLVMTNEEDQDISAEMTEIMEQVRILEGKDLYLCGHNARVANYSSMILQRYLPDQSTKEIYISALMHDVGKVKIREEILNKRSRLNDEEFEEIKNHPVYSYDMIMEMMGDERIAKNARWHHEKLDGSGYPDGITADKLSVEVRIISIADIFDALTTSRSYRKRYTFDEALEIMQTDVDNGKIDKDIFEVLKQLIDEEYIIEGHDDRIQHDSTW